MRYEIEVLALTTFTLSVDTDDGDMAGDKGMEAFYQQMKAMKNTEPLSVAAFDVKNYFVYPKPERDLDQD